MAKIVFYDFWEEKIKRKPIAKFRSFDEIKINKSEGQDIVHTKLEDQIVILKGHKYKIISVDNTFKKNTTAGHHITNNEMICEILVESVGD